MSMPISAATNAYSQAQKLISDAGKTTPGQEQAVPSALPDFGELVSENIQSVAESGKVSDQMSIDMVNGNANVVDVVTAIAETELAIESVVAVRDRVIQAYEEIMRMPI